MPLHFNDLDVVSEAAGLDTALIVSCNMCPAVTVAAREEKPFIRLFRNFLKSTPFEHYVANLQSALKEQGIRTDVFRSPVPHQWFMCMWTTGRCRKLRESAKRYDGIIVLGCESAVETVRASVGSSECRIIEGMEVSGIMNAKLKVTLPCDVSFEDCKVVPISRSKTSEMD